VGRPKGSKNKSKLAVETLKDIRAEVRSAMPAATATQPRDEKGRLLSGGGSLNPGGRIRSNITQLCREAVEGAGLLNVLREAGEGQRKVTREQLRAIEILVTYGYGKPTETHLVGAMPEEQRDAAADLSRDQLLGLLDTSSAGNVAVTAAQATVDAEVIEQSSIAPPVAEPGQDAVTTEETGRALELGADVTHRTE
jgi:hypothetical protein